MPVLAFCQPRRIGQYQHSHQRDGVVSEHLPDLQRWRTPRPRQVPRQREKGQQHRHDADKFDVAAEESEDAGHGQSQVNGAVGGVKSAV